MTITESTIWHGDSRLLVPEISQPVDLIITDPPYGMDHLSNFAETAQGMRFVRKLDGDVSVGEALLLFDAVMRPLAHKTVADADMYVFCRWNMIDVWVDAVNKLPEFEVKTFLIWDKIYLGMGDVEACWPFSFEIILYAKKGRRHLTAPRRNSTLTFPRVDQQHMIHPTEKPIELLMELIKISSWNTNFVVDPFSGSGSTVVAAKRLGRVGLGIESDEFYIDRSRERLKQEVFDFS